MNDDIKIQLCRDDFYLMMSNAVFQSGGADRLVDWKRMKFEDLVDLLAHNGIRMVYMPEKHMNALKVVWDNPTETTSSLSFGRKKDGVLPTKRQLLCDQKDLGEEDETRGT